MPTQISYTDGAFVSTFDAAHLSNVTIIYRCDLLAASLPASTLEFSIYGEDVAGLAWKNGARLDVSHNGRYIGTFYVTNAVQQTADKFTVSATDMVGVLSSISFAGGDYTDSTTVETILCDILGGTVHGSQITGGMFPLVFGDGWIDTERDLIGLLTQQTARDAIAKALFAWGKGFILTTDGNAYLRVFRPNSTPIKTIPRNRTKIGSTMDKQATVTGVQLKTYYYVEDEKGSILIGDQHFTQVENAPIVRTIGTQGSENVKTASCTLTNLAGFVGGVSATDAMAEYYAKNNIAKASFPWDGERLGDCIGLYSRLGLSFGNIQKMTLHLSGIVMADVETLVSTYEQAGLFWYISGHTVSGGIIQ